jgi:hypothetical protein
MALPRNRVSEPVTGLFGRMQYDVVQRAVCDFVLAQGALRMSATNTLRGASRIRSEER